MHAFTSNVKMVLQRSLDTMLGCTSLCIQSCSVEAEDCGVLQLSSWTLRTRK